MAKRIEPLKYLTRPDKWYLGGGNRLLWAPPFPVWLDYPGFWDKAHYYNIEIEPVFTWTILDEEGNEIPLRAVERSWDPSRLTSRYAICDMRFENSQQRTSDIAHPTSNLRIYERKCCLPNDVLTSVIRIENRSAKPRRLHVVAWTTQPSHPSKKSGWLTGVEFHRNTIHFTKHIQTAERPHFQFECALGIDRKAASYTINLSEGSAIQPHWALTPFAERCIDGKLPNEVKLSGVSEDGLVWLALAASIELRAKSEEDVSVFFAAAPTRAETTSNIHFASKQSDPIRISEENWNDHFSSVPYFSCSDKFLTRYYWYRWYGLRLNTIRGEEGNYHHPAVCEGIGYFRAPISYSAMCHMLENRWMHDPALARGSLMTFIDNQRADGGFRGYIDVDHYRQEMPGVSVVEPFYHANWGNPLLELHRVHPDEEYLKRVYDGLVKYAAYFDRKRDAEGSGLYDIDNHYETGQEYMHRYLAVDPNGDKENWGEVFRLKGVDVTVYIYELKKALAWAGEKIKRGDAEVAELRRGAEKIRQAILAKMWDPDEEMFFDVDPKTGARTKVKAATCFYPYMTDLVSETHLPGFHKHLFNPKEFWTKFPVPSSSVDDEYFSAEAEWKGKRMNCPWNGRVWPMTNSHIAEAIAQTAVRFQSAELRAKSVEFITKFIRMMFSRGDPGRPNCFEHYNPFTGEPSMYRGIDDYQHSWVNDLIIRYVAGVRPTETRLIVDPFEFDLASFVLDDLLIQGHRVKVERRKSDFKVWLDGVRVGTSNIGVPIIVAFTR